MVCDEPSENELPSSADLSTAKGASRSGGGSTAKPSRTPATVAKGSKRGGEGVKAAPTFPSRPFPIPDYVAEQHEAFPDPPAKVTAVLLPAGNPQDADTSAGLLAKKRTGAVSKMAALTALKSTLWALSVPSDREESTLRGSKEEDRSHSFVEALFLEPEGAVDKKVMGSEGGLDEDLTDAQRLRVKRLVAEALNAALKVEPPPPSPPMPATQKGAELLSSLLSRLSQL